MKARFWCSVLTFLVCLSLVGSARENLGYLLRTDGYSAEADALIRLVKLELSPQWAELFNDPKNKEERRVLAGLIGAFIDTGVPSERPIRSLSTAFVISTLEEGKGKCSLELQMKFTPNPTTRKQTLAGMERLADSIRQTAEHHGALKLAVEFSPDVDAVERSAFRERGSEVFLVLPAGRTWNRHIVDYSLTR